MGGFLEKYICVNCGYVYETEYGDPSAGIPPGTPFADLPEDWVCPVCYVSKETFDLL
jgi:rubredoxin